jgi:hypothetical protein
MDILFSCFNCGWGENGGKRGWLYGMEMNVYKSHFPVGCPVVSGTKLKLYKPVSQIVRAPVSNYFGTK